MPATTKTIIIFESTEWLPRHDVNWGYAIKFWHGLLRLVPVIACCHLGYAILSDLFDIFHGCGDFCLVSGWLSIVGSRRLVV
jgi:hypothetical protein